MSLRASYEVYTRELKLPNYARDAEAQNPSLVSFRLFLVQLKSAIFND